MDLSDPVSIAIVAERLDVAADTVVKWRQRGIFPEPAMKLGHSPVWAWAVVEAWARETGRLT